MKLHDDPRVAAVGLEAIGLLGLAGSWMRARRATVIPREQLARWAGRKTHWLVSRLLDEGLLVAGPEGTFQAPLGTPEPPPVRAPNPPRFADEPARRTPPGSCPFTPSRAIAPAVTGTIC